MDEPSIMTIDREHETAASRVDAVDSPGRPRHHFEQARRQDVSRLSLYYRNVTAQRGTDPASNVGGISTRALQTGFRRFRNTTPMTYLRAIRLELARTDLANAGSANSSVAIVANALGFGHLGRFARDYQQRFGELPSETLRRGSVGRGAS